MKQPGSGTFDDRAREALDNQFLRKAVRFTSERLSRAREQSVAAFDHWAQWREQGRKVRRHVVEHLDYYLEQFSRNLEARGQQVHFAADAREAAELVLQIVTEQEAHLVAKSKSMVSEEVGVNHCLAAHGVECLETDLGEWIIQLARETPSHIIIPAIHKSRQQVQQLFEAEGGERLAPETAILAGYARKRLRERFAAADVGMTGCNFAIADTGSIVLFTNEGNGRMVTTLPRTHIVMMGMERILPSLADLELMAELLPRSATGQKLTTYMNVITGARRPGEADGAHQLHVIVLDNRRSEQLGPGGFQHILDCIRCGACLNVCPVYRQLGGHAYGSVYSGPIGAVLTPLLAPWGDTQAAELANASSLCGACAEVCPVKIPLHDMLVDLRARKALSTDQGVWEPLAFRVFGAVTARPQLYGFFTSLVRRVARRLGPRLLRLLGPRATRLLERLPVLSGWTRHRALPELAERSFREQYEELEP